MKLLIPPLLAIGFTLVGATDWELKIQTPNGHTETSCAKNRNVCELAGEAATIGMLPDIPRGTTWSCKPKPGCFSERSDCIINFNCP